MFCGFHDLSILGALERVERGARGGKSVLRIGGDELAEERAQAA
jgi:hypothetical protein